MRKLAALFLCTLALLAPSFAAAQGEHAGAQVAHVGAQVVSVERWVEEWDHAAQRWVRVADDDAIAMLDADIAPEASATHVTKVTNGLATQYVTTVIRDAARFQATLYAPQSDLAIARYGPFRVLDNRRAAIVGSTGAAAPLHFDAMLRDFPGLEVLEMIEAPGTSHDLANLELGRRIRAAGLATHVPNGGSVRSGAVELFLAGATRTIDKGAEFAVHSWLDSYGREPQDFAEDAPENRLYLDYYIEMGMSGTRARQFYAMTNSVPHHRALWLSGDEMRAWANEQRIWDAPSDQVVQVHAPASSHEVLSVQLSASEIAGSASL